MKNQYLILIGIFLYLTPSVNTFAQVQTPLYISTAPHSNAFYEYLPEGYPASGVKYPLLIFAHGIGELGQGTAASLPLVLRNGPPKLIDNGTFPTSFTVNGETFRFIVLSPQFTEWPSGPDIESVINYAKNNYNVDINRIYLTGLSMGGGIVWNYGGGSFSNASRLAAIVPIAGAADPYTPFAVNIGNANLPVWATHNQGDGTVPVANTDTYINIINTTLNPPNPLAKKTIFPVGGHDAWSTTYNPTYRENGLNVYEWMLQYQRSFTVLPVTGLQLNAGLSSNQQVKLTWSTTAEINTQGFSILRSTDGSTFNSIGFVSSTGSNGGGGAYSFADNAPLKGKNYYRLEVKDNDNQQSFSDIKMVETKTTVAISFYPNPAQNVLNIQSPMLYKNAQLRISNAAGQNVLQQLLNGTGILPVKVSALTPGVYYGKIIAEDKVERFKFIKE